MNGAGDSKSATLTLGGGQASGAQCNKGVSVQLLPYRYAFVLRTCRMGQQPVKQAGLLQSARIEGMTRPNGVALKTCIDWIKNSGRAVRLWR